MPYETLILNDNKKGIVSKDKHFSDLVREYMGKDAAEWFDNRINELNAEIQSKQEEIETLKEEWDKIPSEFLAKENEESDQ